MKNGIRHGKGTETGFSGMKYEGQQEDNKRHGYGIMTWTIGDK